MPVFSMTMPTLTGVPDAALLDELDEDPLDELDGDELQAATASAIAATPAAPASALRHGLVCVPPMSPP
jgi:hypothetical protein